MYQNNDYYSNNIDQSYLNNNDQNYSNQNYTEGTSVFDLKNTQYNNSPNDIENFNQYNNYSNENNYNNNNNNNYNPNNFVEKINNSFEKKNKKYNQDEEEDEDYDEDEEEHQDDDKENKKSNKKKRKKNSKLKDIEYFENEGEDSYFNMFREGLLLWIIYMILSQNLVKNIFGLIIDAINPNNAKIKKPSNPRHLLHILYINVTLKNIYKN